MVDGLRVHHCGKLQGEFVVVNSMMANEYGRLWYNDNGKHDESWLLMDTMVHLCLMDAMMANHCGYFCNNDSIILGSLVVIMTILWWMYL